MCMVLGVCGFSILSPTLRAKTVVTPKAGADSLAGAEDEENQSQIGMAETKTENTQLSQEIRHGAVRGKIGRFRGGGHPGECQAQGIMYDRRPGTVSLTTGKSRMSICKKVQPRLVGIQILLLAHTHGWSYSRLVLHGPLSLHASSFEGYIRIVHLEKTIPLQF